MTNVKTKFTAEEQKVFNTALDLTRDLLTYDKSKVTQKDIEKQLKDTINDDILGGLSLYQAFRRNQTTIFEIVEEIINVTINEDVTTSPFVDAFVEIKNRGLGDKTAFYAEGGLLSVATFAGNHWDTDREAIDIGDEVTLPKEWLYIHCYEDLERFLLGITPLSKIADKIYKSFNKFLKDRIFMQFQNVMDAVPAEFSKTGNDAEAVNSLCDLVAAAGGYENVTIAGTPAALRKIAGFIPDNMFANSQKEARAMTGTPKTWDGKTLMPIPQVLKAGTYTFALDDSVIFVLGTDVQPIKLELFNDTRTDIDTEGKKHNDQSVDIQAQVRIGLGMVLPQYFGCLKLV